MFVPTNGQPRSDETAGVNPDETLADSKSAAIIPACESPTRTAILRVELVGRHSRSWTAQSAIDDEIDVSIESWFVVLLASALRARDPLKMSGMATKDTQTIFVEIFPQPRLFLTGCSRTV